MTERLGCRSYERSLSAKTPIRTICRWEREAVLERHRGRMQDAQALI